MARSIFIITVAVSSIVLSLIHVCCRAAEQSLDSALFDEAARVLQTGYHLIRFEASIATSNKHPKPSFAPATAIVPQLRLCLGSGLDSETVSDRCIYLCVHATRDFSLRGVSLSVRHSEQERSPFSQASCASKLVTQVDHQGSDPVIRVRIDTQQPALSTGGTFYITLASTQQPATATAVCVTAVSAMPFSLEPVKPQKLFGASVQFGPDRPSELSIVPNLPPERATLRACLVVDRVSELDEKCMVRICQQNSLLSAECVVSEGHTRSAKEVMPSTPLS